MEPGERHREHGTRAAVLAQDWTAAMEPGERHREHHDDSSTGSRCAVWPQWSPVNVTGNTVWSPTIMQAVGGGAAMEPGERHREHATTGRRWRRRLRPRRNGAR